MGLFDPAFWRNLGAEARAGATPGRRLTARIALAVIALLVGAITVDLVASLGGPVASETPPSAAPAGSSAGAAPTMKEAAAAADISGVDAHGDVLTVAYVARTALDDPQFLEDAGYQAGEIGRAFQKGVREDNGRLASVDLVLIAPVHDRLGNVSPKPVFVADFPVADLRAAKIDNLGPQEFLGVANRVAPFDRSAKTLLLAHCALPVNQTDAHAFCQLVRRR
jgi:hypothetical protein